MSDSSLGNQLWTNKVLQKSIDFIGFHVKIRPRESPANQYRVLQKTSTFTRFHVKFQPRESTVKPRKSTVSQWSITKKHRCYQISYKNPASGASCEPLSYYKNHQFYQISRQIPASVVNCKPMKYCKQHRFVRFHVKFQPGEPTVNQYSIAKNIDLSDFMSNSNLEIHIKACQNKSLFNDFSLFRAAGFTKKHEKQTCSQFSAYFKPQDSHKS